jgi:hypothetical protein
MLTNISEELTTSIIRVIEVVDTSETSANIYQNSLLNIPEDSRPKTLKRFVLKSSGLMCKAVTVALTSGRQRFQFLGAIATKV